MLTVSHLMSPAVVTIGPGATLREALTLFVERRISGAPVVSAGRVLGVVSATDLLHVETTLPVSAASWYDWAGDEDTVPEPWRADEDLPAYFGEAWADPSAEAAAALGRRGDVLSRHTVAEAMSRPICWVPPELSLRDAAAYMTRAGVHRVLVLDGDRLVGVLSAVDIVRAVGQGLVL